MPIMAYGTQASDSACQPSLSVTVPGLADSESDPAYIIIKLMMMVQGRECTH